MNMVQKLFRKHSPHLSAFLIDSTMASAMSVRRLHSVPASRTSRTFRGTVKPLTERLLTPSWSP